jgi:D-sedoheptulose 7-phosphate isomerase
LGRDITAAGGFGENARTFAIVAPADQNPAMANDMQSYFEQHIAVAQRVSSEVLPKITEVGNLLCQTFERGNKLLTFGNGGSAADAMHLAEELIGRFLRNRRPFPATALCADGPAMSCITNDFGYAEVFARQVQALARPGDVVMGFSTSGNSENVIRGLKAGREKSAVTVALLGCGGGKAAPLADHAIVIPTNVASHVQEMHILIVHLLCEIVDLWAVGQKGD